MGNSEDAVAAAAKKAPVEVPPARLPKAPEPAPAPLTSSESADERKLKELLERARSVRPAQVEEPEVFVHRESAQPAEAVAPAAPAAPVASAPVEPAAPAAPEPTVETTDPLAVDSEAPVDSVPVESFALPAPIEDAPAAEAPAAEAQPEPAAEVPAEPASAAEKPKSSSKKQRVSVPAWDDIIFGGRK